MRRMGHLLAYVVGGLVGFFLCALFSAQAIRAGDRRIAELERELDEARAWP